MFVRKYAPQPSDTPPRATAPATAAAAPRPKKNKPMNKDEQDARIRDIRGKLHGFDNPGSAEEPGMYISLHSSSNTLHMLMNRTDNLHKKSRLQTKRVAMSRRARRAKKTKSRHCCSLGSAQRSPKGETINRNRKLRLCEGIMLMLII